MKKICLSILASMIASVSNAELESIPEESGFSGFVTLGVSANRVESSMIAGTDLGDITDDTVDSIFSGPDGKTATTPAFGGVLKYTFASTRTQLFLGNTLADCEKDVIGALK